MEKIEQLIREQNKDYYTTSFGHLPPEVYSNIESYLGPHDHAKLAKTSKQSHMFSDEKSLIPKMKSLRFSSEHLIKKVLSELKKKNPDINWIQYLREHLNKEDFQKAIAIGLCEAFQNNNQKAIEIIRSFGLDIYIFWKNIDYYVISEWEHIMTRYLENGFPLVDPKDGFSIFHFYSTEIYSRNVLDKLRWAIDHSTKADLNTVFEKKTPLEDLLYLYDGGNKIKDAIIKLMHSNGAKTQKHLKKLSRRTG